MPTAVRRMVNLATEVANQLTRTRKAISPHDLWLFRRQLNVSFAGGKARVTYPLDQKTDPHRKFKEIARYDLLAHLVKGKFVLDIGSGSFYGASIMAEKASTVVGIELSKIAVIQAKITWRKVRNLSCLSGGDLTGIRGIYDVATSINVIEHMPREAALNLLKQAHERLTPNGQFILCTPRDRSILRGKYENPDHEKEYNEVELAELVREAGFQIETRFIQNMREIKVGNESDIDPAERGWFLWVLRKA